MPTFHIEAGGQSFEIDAPDEETALRAYKTHGVGQGGGGGATPTAATPTPAGTPIPTADAPTAPPESATDWFVRNFTHLPLVGVQALLNTGTGTVNLPATLGNVAKHGLEWGIRGFPQYPDIPEFPEVDLGANAKPQGAGEGYYAAGVGGFASGLLGGAASRVGAAAKATGKEIADEVPSLVGGVVKSGVLPAEAAELANQNLPLDDLSPGGKALTDMLVGATAGVLAHGMLKGHPVEAVASRLGTAESSADAGDVAQDATRKWRTALPAKVEALKDVRDVPLTPEGDVTASAMFGKVPLHSATVDMTETMRIADELAKHGGVNAPFLHAFGSDMPPRAQQILHDIAARNEPIVQYPAKEAKPAGTQTYNAGQGPFAEGPIIEGERTPGTGGTVVPRGTAGPQGPASPPPNFTMEPPSATPPNAAGAKGPLVATGRETDYRPNFVLGESSPLVRPELPPLVKPLGEPEEPRGPSYDARRNARGRFIKKGEGLVPVEPPGVPAEVPAPGSTALATPQAPQPGGFGGKGEAPGPQSAGPVGAPLREAENPHPGFVEPEGKIVGYKSPLQDAMALRSYIGEMTSRGMMPKGSTAAQWDALYRGLSADIGNTMELHGARPEWDNYNVATTKLYHDGQKFTKYSSDTNPGKDDAKPGEAVTSLWNRMAKDPGEITAIREHMPEAADAIAAGFLRTKPQVWNKLPEATQAALVPNPFDRLRVSLHAGPKPSVSDTIGTYGKPILGGSAGYALGEMIKPHYGAEGSTALMSPGAWRAAGIATPALLDFLGRAKENPRMFKVPVAGAYAGASGGAAGDGEVSPLLRSK